MHCSYTQFDKWQDEKIFSAIGIAIALIGQWLLDV